MNKHSGSAFECSGFITLKRMNAVIFLCIFKEVIIISLYLFTNYLVILPFTIASMRVITRMCKSVLQNSSRGLSEQV